MTKPLTAEQLKDLCLTAIDDLKGKSPLALNIEEHTDVMSWMVIASGTSSRHIKAVAENVAIEAKNHGVMPLGVEGGAGSDWLLVDLGDVVVNIMLPEARANYDLERLWSEGKFVAPGVNEL